MNTFKNDLAVGQAAEREFAQILTNTVPDSSVLFNNSSTLDGMREYDVRLITKDLDIKFEVKYDIMSTKTNNVCVEYRCLATSKSPYFVYKIDDKFHVVTAAALHYLARIKGKDVVGNDGQRISLVKREDFNQIVIRTYEGINGQYKQAS